MNKFVFAFLLWIGCIYAWEIDVAQPLRIMHEGMSVLEEIGFSKVELQDVKTSNMGTLFLLDYSIHLKDSAKAKEMIDELRTRNGNLSIAIQMDIQNFMKL